MNVKFNPERHEYSVTDRIIPSVTQILKNAGYIDDRYFTAESRDRGTAVHELCRRYTDGIRIDKTGRSLESLEYVNAFAKWMQEKHVYVILSETIVYGNIDGHEYAGKFDILAEINGKRVLVDLKTGGKIKWHLMQLAAYAIGFLPDGKRTNPDRLMDLYVIPDGKYRESYINPVELPEQINLFKDALCC
jgi:hypothetical protein